MATGKVNRFAEKPPRALNNEVFPAQAQLPNTIERLVKLQEAQGVLKEITEGSVYRGQNPLIAGHGNHTNNKWADHSDHSEYTERP